MIKMSTNVNEMNYELVDERKILFDYDEVNKIEVALGEDLDHFSVKAMLTYILNSELKHDVICDFYIPGLLSSETPQTPRTPQTPSTLETPPTADVYDIAARVIYNFQPISIYSNDLMFNDLLIQNCVEVVNINIDQLPDDIFQRYLKLKEFVFSD